MISTLKRKINVVDSLTSTSAVDALSANQGKVLNEKIQSLINHATISDTNTDAGGSLPLYGNISCVISAKCSGGYMAIPFYYEPNDRWYLKIAESQYPYSQKPSTTVTAEYWYI